MLAATAFLICCSTITTPVMNDSGIPADDHSSASTHELKRGAFFGAKIIPVTGEVRERLRLGAGARALIDQVIAAADDETPSALERDPNGWTDLLAQAGAKLEGWTRGPIPPRGKIGARSQWSLDATTGILVCQGDGGHEWLRWDKELEDCVFHVEWRFTVVPGKKGYNSGIYARNSADATVWHQAQTGDGSGGYLFGDTPSSGTIKRFNLSKQQSSSRVKPAGEWNVFEITCRGKEMTLWVNGAIANRWLQCDVPKGYVGLEAEGYRIEFRNVKVKPLDGTSPAKRETKK